MAFNTRSFAGNNANQNNGFEKASGFINISFPRKNGSMAQIGKVPLRLSQELEKQLLDFIAENTEENLPKVVNKMTFSFHLVQSGADTALDL